MHILGNIDFYAKRQNIVRVKVFLPAALNIFFVFCTLTIAPRLYAQGPEVIFDARGTSFTRDGKKQIFDGDVIAIGAGALITADKIVVDREKDMIEADGHIIIVSRNQIFQGSSLVFQLRTGDFKLTDAVMVANDAEEAARVTERVTVLVFAALLVGAIIGIAFAVGYGIGKLLL